MGGGAGDPSAPVLARRGGMSEHSIILRYQHETGRTRARATDADAHRCSLATIE